MLAADRINSFVVIFGYENGGFMAPLYPYFFDVRGFSRRRIGRHYQRAAGAQHGGIQGHDPHRARARHRRHRRDLGPHLPRAACRAAAFPVPRRTPGSACQGWFGASRPKISSPYTKAALHRFLEVFPDIDALQFRMHDESGLKHEEMQPFWHDVFASMKQTHPNLRLDLRAKICPMR